MAILYVYYVPYPSNSRHTPFGLRTFLAEQVTAEESAILSIKSVGQ